MTAPDPDREAAELLERLTQAAVGLTDLGSIYLGDRLGYYAALADGRPVTAAELARATATDARYAREWLEHQAASGLLRALSAAEAPERRAYALPPGHRSVLAARDSPAHFAAVARFFVGIVARAADVAAAFRDGSGVPYERYGADVREAQGEVNRTSFLRGVGGWIAAAAPGVHARLLGRGGRIVDVGCGIGWSSIALARAYPAAVVDAFDPDRRSIARAREHAAAAGAARITFHEAGFDAVDGSADLVTFFEVIHDLSDPVGALRTGLRAARPDGALLVADERVGDAFEAPASDGERLLYGMSLLFCLPAGRAAAPSAATGAVMRPETLRRYASEAGASRVEDVPVEHPLWHFYRIE